MGSVEDTLGASLVGRYWSVIVGEGFEKFSANGGGGWRRKGGGSMDAEDIDGGAG